MVKDNKPFETKTEVMVKDSKPFETKTEVMVKDNKPCETNLCNELGIYVLFPFSRLFDYYFVPYLFH
jgi:hypothetical protein